MSPREYIEKALDLQFGDDQQKAQAKQLYEQAIAACEDRGFDYLYAHYELMRMHAEEDTERAALYGKTCLDILSSVIQSGAVMHFTDLGLFQEEVIRYASNSIAWHTCLVSDDQQRLQEALDILAQGEKYVDSADHAYLLDTKVRLLIKLGHQEEAYQVVRSSCIKYPYVTYFDDILYEEDYRHWRIEFDQGMRVVFSDKEKQFLQKMHRIYAKLQTEHSLEDGQVRHVAEHIPAKTVIGRDEAVKDHGLPDYSPAGSYYLLYHGDLSLHGPLDMKWVLQQAEEIATQQHIYGIIVDGDIHVKGDIIDDDYLYMYIKGTLRCDYLFSYNGHQTIRGDAYIRYGTYGEYNDGQLEIHGTLHTPYIITDDHAMPTRAEGDFVLIEAGNGSSRYDVAVGSHPNPEWPWIWEYFEDSQRLFAPDFWTEQDTFSIDRLLTFVKAGKNPFANP